MRNKNIARKILMICVVGGRGECKIDFRERQKQKKMGLRDC